MARSSALRFASALLSLGIASAAAPPPMIDDVAAARALKQKFVALTESWADAMTFTPDEQRAMEAGRQQEDLMMRGLDDPLARRVLAAGEPSFDGLAAMYPGKVLDRTVLGTWSDPRTPSKYNDEFAIWWNGAISANLIKGRFIDRYGAEGTQPLAHMTNVVFRVGPDGEMFGRTGRAYTRLVYELGYLPIVTAVYEKAGIRYEETAFADKPEGQTGGWDVAFVRFEMTNISAEPLTAELAEEVVLMQGAGTARGRMVLDSAGAVVLAHSDSRAEFDADRQRLRHRFHLPPGAAVSVCFKIPYLPDDRGLLRGATVGEFEEAHARVAEFWSTLLARGPEIEVPEERVNNVWRALLLENFVLADGPKLTYGAGLRYNDSTYPQENGFAAHTFEMYGYADYADVLQRSFVPVSVTRDSAGRKYQNRRAMVLHHLLENYRLTGMSDLFDRFRDDYYRVADEIVADRHSTMTETNRGKLHWGLLPPDKPGADMQASTEAGYVLGHDVTNCQGLADFGEFLVRTGFDRSRGERYREEARQFRARLLEVMRDAAVRVPGRPPFFDLQTLYFGKPPDDAPDPYFHYWVDMEFHYNFFNPDDAPGEWLADYVAQRGGFVLGLTRARPVQDPRYGWVNNVYDAGYYNYRLRRGQIPEFLLGVYSRLAFGMSRHTYVASEGSPLVRYNTQRGGVVGADYSFPNSAANADTLLMLRNMLALEELHDGNETGTLFLLRGAPRAWMQPGKQIRVRRLPTYFGEVSFRVEAANGSLRVHVEPPKRVPYREITLSLPHAREVRVNGALVLVQDDIVRLPYGPSEYVVEARY